MKLIHKTIGLLFFIAITPAMVIFSIMLYETEDGQFMEVFKEVFSTGYKYLVKR